MSEQTIFQPGISLWAIPEEARTESIFKVDYRSAVQGDGYFLGKWIQDGEGHMGGTTLTEPPMRWSVYAESGLNVFEIGDVISADELAINGIHRHTFELSAPNSPEA